MHRFLKYICCIGVLLSVTFLVPAQQRDIKGQLDLYRDLCSQCLDLRNKVAAEGGLLKAEAKTLVANFLSLNKELKSVEAVMTSAQRHRFYAISQWFATGVPPVEEPEDLPCVVQCAEIPTMITTSCHGSELIYIRDHQEPTGQISENVKTADMYILANLAAPDFSYGLMAGYKRQRYGCYLSFRSNYTPFSSSYFCTSDGVLEGGGMFWASGEKMDSEMSICAGVLYGFRPRVSMYAGAGYGSHRLAWEDVDGQWAEISDLSHKGLAVEAGALLSWKRLAFSLGVSSVLFRTAELVCGVGVKF